jgi:hypothetical protein
MLLVQHTRQTPLHFGASLLERTDIHMSEGGGGHESQLGARPSWWFLFLQSQGLCKPTDDISTCDATFSGSSRLCCCSKNPLDCPLSAGWFGDKGDNYRRRSKLLVVVVACCGRLVFIIMSLSLDVAGRKKERDKNTTKKTKSL